MRNKILYRSLLGAVLLLVLAACSDQPTLSPLSPDAVILSFGDSLTEGVGANKEQSYPAVLATLTGRRVINAGISGEESDAGLARLPQLLATWQPDLVILGHGGNDFLRQRDTDQTQANLTQMIALARKQGSEVVLLGIPRPGLLVRTHSLYDELADELDVPLQANAIAEILADKTLKSDGCGSFRTTLSD
ncbi:GDSL-type esterase/lipase family protein [Thiorhodovibrio frisius]|uniref:Lysophospholipase L1-like esterase n=1 Tax=Thiorhodovibrio frisius TaxID=631362 RepID=H8YYX7_9GAMM|nr:GDSL-type esterase/lipase family protein [Thiorhodovibrio frisius]EIC23653.1 lysophospholipase L1-like esterase [Thiorhodovibrio frisius]WPL23254.1 Acyl-CoA thioesterase I precursor [Thiorhodovibrio frisius]